MATVLIMSETRFKIAACILMAMLTALCVRGKEPDEPPYIRYMDDLPIEDRIARQISEKNDSDVCIIIYKIPHKGYRYMVYSDTAVVRYAQRSNRYFMVGEKKIPVLMDYDYLYDENAPLPEDSLFRKLWFVKKDYKIKKVKKIWWNER